MSETKNKWEVSAEGYSTGGYFAQVSCHHRAGRSRGVNLSACGGCYARATDALQLIEETGDASVAGEVLAAMRAEKKPKKGPTP